MTKIINLLNVGKKVDIVVSTSSNDISTSSAMRNSDVGICPKCQKSMSSAQIINNEDVFFCESCRVAVPKPNIG